VRRPIALLLLAIAAAAISAGCGSSGSGSDAGAEAPPYGYAAPPPATTSPSSSAAPATVATATGDLGTFLVGPGGRALYLFEKDAGSTSACTGACADAWPPLTSSGAPEAGGTARADLLATTTRADRDVQVTYAGHPLYLYTGDAAAGDTNGQGVAGEWYLVAPEGTALGDERG
jgi:predicted lipoprotein with Yx(FWY)xxD motif